MSWGKDEDESDEKDRHEHFAVTCGRCRGVFESCGWPCFAYCPHCRIKNILWIEEDHVG